VPPLSRRQFLQLAGITLAASQLPDLSRWANIANTYGRALLAAPVYARPDATSAMIRHVWPDSVLPLTGVHDQWYRADDGYIERSALQPISPRLPQSAPQQLPFWAEVVAPVAPVWRWCAVDAPPVTRIGHGGVVRILDRLPGWYAVADENDVLLGWSQAACWTPVVSQTRDFPLQIVVNGNQMTVHRLGQRVAAASVSFGQSVPSDTYTLEKGPIGGQCCRVSSETSYYGASWQLRLGNQFELTSVYWHNRFGQSVPGPSLQVTPILGRWLYMTAASNSIITIQRQA